MSIPPKITLKGDKNYARSFIGAAQSQLRILENQMSFQNLKQGVRKVRFNSRAWVEAIVCFNLSEVIIHCLPIIKKEIVPEFVRSCCLVELLTFTGTIFVPKSTAFCVETNLDVVVDEGEEGYCEVVLTKKGRTLPNTTQPENGVNFLSQCRYVYEDPLDTDIIRKMSLFHYNYYQSDGTEIILMKKVKIKNIEGGMDLEFELSGLSTITGSLSEDLKTFYLTIFTPLIGWDPDEVWFTSFQYDLVGVAGGAMEWELVKTGTTPIQAGRDFSGQSLDRAGHCGCWKHTGVEEVFVKGDASTKLINCTDSQAGYWKEGTEVTFSYLTFDINIEAFVDTEKVKGMYLSPIAKDYVTLKGLHDKIASYPTTFQECEYSCTCVKCEPQVAPHAIATQSASTSCKTYSGSEASTATYNLFNGLEEFIPTWNNHFYVDAAGQIDNRGKFVGGCPGEPPSDWGYVETGSGEKFSGFRTRIASTLHTAALVGSNADTGRWEKKSCESVALIGWGTMMQCGGAEEWDGWYGIITRCGGNIYDTTEVVNISEKIVLSPFEMTLLPASVVLNVFIAYDQETESLIRGIRYQEGSEDPKTWKITAVIPTCFINSGGSKETSVDCEEKDITSELEELLSAEHFKNIEAIFFR